MSITMFGGLHIDLAALKTAENFVKVAGGQENWSSKMLHHLCKQTLSEKSHLTPTGRAQLVSCAPLPLKNTHQEHDFCEVN